MQLLRRLPAGSVVRSQPGTFTAALEVNRIVDEAVIAHDLVRAELRDPRTRSRRGKPATDHFHPDEHGYADMAAIFGEAVRRRFP